MLVVRSHELPFFIAAYTLTGRFNPEHEFERNPNPRIAELNLRAARVHQSSPRAEDSAIREARTAECESVLGSPEIWKAYKTLFTPMLDNALREGLFPSRREVKRFFKDLDHESRPVLASDGSPLLQVGKSTVGLTTKTILAESSDQRLAYQLMLAKVDATLKTSLKNRETLPQFESDWELLMQLANNEHKKISAATF